MCEPLYMECFSWYNNITYYESHTNVPRIIPNVYTCRSSLQYAIFTVHSIQEFQQNIQPINDAEVMSYFCNS